MSYILDALKKSEKERRRGTVPDPLAVQYSFSQEKKRYRKYWPYFLLIALMINAGAIYVFWFGQGQANKMDAAVPRSENITVVESSQPSAGMANTGDEEISSAGDEKISGFEKSPEHRHKASIPAEQSQKAGAGSGVKAGPEKPAQLSGEIGTYETAQGGPQHPVPPDNAATEQKPAIPGLPPPDPDKIYALSELPPAIQQHLPAFTVSAFLYSDDPAARMARVNGKMMREGDLLPEGLKLNEIRQNELIFGYQNYRFRLGIK